MGCENQQESDDVGLRAIRLRDAVNFLLTSGKEVMIVLTDASKYSSRSKIEPSFSISTCVLCKCLFHETRVRRQIFFFYIRSVVIAHLQILMQNFQKALMRANHRNMCSSLPSPIFFLDYYRVEFQLFTFHLLDGRVL